MSAKTSTGTRFGRGRRLGIGFVVVLNVALAGLVWLVLNYLFTEPALRKTFDWSPSAVYSLSAETERLIADVREQEGGLTVDTFFLRLHPSQDPGGIHTRVKRLTYDLLERIRFAGGQKIQVTHHNIDRDIRAAGQRVEATGAGEDEIALTIGKKTRRVHLMRDLADIDRPDAGGVPGQSRSAFVLRGYKGEQAIASALKSMLVEDEQLRAYWVEDWYCGQPSDARAEGYSGLARRLVADGFVNQRITLATTRTIPEDCRLLLVLQPSQPIGPREAAMIQSYVRQGGSVLMTTGFGRSGEALGFQNLLGPLGIQVGKKQILNGIPSQSPDEPPLYGDRLCEYLVIDRGWNATHPATRVQAREARSRRSVPSLIPRARSVQLREERPEEMLGSYLITSNPFAWEVRPDPQVVQSYRPPSEDAIGQRQIAVAVEVTNSGERKGRIAVLGGLFFVNGGPQGRPLIDSHGRFAQELSGWLASREARVDVPERYRRSPRIQITPQQVDRVHTLVIYAIPLAFLGLAFFLVFWRRRA